MNKILCFRNSKLGDFLISIPSLKLIRQRNPNCKIYYLTAKIRNVPTLPKKIGSTLLVNKFIYFDNNIKGYDNLLKKIRKLKFKKVYCLQENSIFYKNIRNFVFFSLCKIDNKIGFFYKNKNFLKFSEALQVTQRVRPKIKYSTLYKLINFSKDNESKIYNFNYITISLGGFSQPRIWDLKNWSVLSELLLKKYNFKILLVGTNSDKIKANYLVSKNKKRIISLCGKTSLKKLFNIIRFSKFHITNDNGSMHVASLYQKKSLCLFNNHDPEGKWYPINKNAIIIRPNKGVNKIKPNEVFKKFILNF